MPYDLFIYLRGIGKVYIAHEFDLGGNAEEIERLVGMEEAGHYVDLGDNKATVWAKKE